MLASKVTPTGSNASGSSGPIPSTLGATASPSASTSSSLLKSERKDSNDDEISKAILDSFGKEIAATKIKSSAMKATSSNISPDNTDTNNVTDPKVVKKRKVVEAHSHVSCESDCTCSGKLKTRSEKSASNSGADTGLTSKTKSLPEKESKSITEIIKFIEGKEPNKKDSEKKAAKKAKQKQKKEDVKRVEELVHLREQFHDAYFKELDVKNDLKILRSTKKRDKKKIQELETSIKKYGKYKAKIESNILELIGVLKTNTPDFKFSYLPTKEQQDEKLQIAQGSEPPVVPDVTSSKYQMK